MSMFSVTPNGVITVDTSEVRSDVESAYTAALGASLNLDVSTPQGQLIVNDTTMITTAQAAVVAMANETNVYYATGAALDTAAAFYGFYRKQNTPTVVVAQLTGLSGTEIPAGSLCSDGTNEYALSDTVVIPTTGATSGQFICRAAGAIACPAGALNTIVTTIAGWDSVQNLYDGVIGQAAETDNAFRDRITSNFMTARARAMMGAILDNIAALNDVVSVDGAENPSADTVTIDGVSVPAHSIYVTVMGGTGTDIAEVLAKTKTMGAGTVGNTDVSYVDSDIDYRYTYKIYRPTVVPVYVQIQYSTNAYTPIGVDAEIIDVISAYVAGAPLRVGQTVSGGAFAAAFAEYNKIDLLAIKVSTDGDTWTDYIDITKTQVASINTSNITTQRI